MSKIRRNEEEGDESTSSSSVFLFFYKGILSHSKKNREQINEWFSTSKSFSTGVSRIIVILVAKNKAEAEKMRDKEARGTLIDCNMRVFLKNKQKDEGILFEYIILDDIFFLFNVRRSVWKLNKKNDITILSESKKIQVEKKYGRGDGTTIGLPLIRENDALARVIGAKRGNIVKFNKASRTSGRISYYNLVIE
ncbi:MAG: DNA-directed RNA polymerase subunit RpoH/Rpb5 C-terminal domain-containing protein [Promethearchaeota archaeon]